MSNHNVPEVLVELKSDETSVRNAAIKKVIKGIIHDEQIITSLKYIVENDPYVGTRNFARTALDVIDTKNSDKPEQGQKQHNLITSNSVNKKGVIFGILGALTGAVPVSIVKTGIAFSNSAWFCKPLGNETDFPIRLTTCGVFYHTWYPEYLWLYCLFILLGGGLFGFLGAEIGLKRFQEKKLEITSKTWKGLFGWSFTAGIIFDILFIFLFTYPGQ